MKKISILFALLLLVSTGCNKLLDFPPEDVILAEDALQTPEDLQRLLNSCYDVVANIYGGRHQVLAELQSTNLTEPRLNNDLKSVYNRSTNFFITTTNGLYNDYYFAIYRCNILLESFDLIEGLSASERSRIEAEARFIRGFCHWSCAQLWARPYGWTGDNSHLGVVLKEDSDPTPRNRSTVAEVYTSVLADLNAAYLGLPVENDVYANRMSAAGLLANVHFLMGDYTNAADWAGLVINSGQFELEPTPNRHLQDVISTENVFGTVSNIIDRRSQAFLDNYNGSTPELRLSDGFAELMSFTPSDVRNDWLQADGNFTLMRRWYDEDGAGLQWFNIPLVSLTDLHLIRAEALAETNTDLDVAIADINAIRDRAFGEGLFPLDADASAEEIIEAARVEYRKETIGEGKWQAQLKRRGAVEGEDIIIRDAPYDCPGMSIQFPNSETSVAGFVLNDEGGC